MYDMDNVHSYEGFVECIGRTAMQVLSHPPMGGRYKTTGSKLATFIELWNLGDEGKLNLHKEECKRFPIETCI